jgi:hypothetical protein
LFKYYRNNFTNHIYCISAVPRGEKMESIVTERRSSFRYRTSRSAKILSSEGIMDCLVRDLSARGARIEITDAKSLPEKFILKIQGMSERHRCRVAWRTKNMIGIEYL